jgi:hypothetical protein
MTKNSHAYSAAVFDEGPGCSSAKQITSVASA